MSACWQNPVLRTRMSKLGLGEGSIPSVHKIQELLEKAWSVGYDRQPEMHEPFLGSDIWIGPHEVFTLLSSIGIRCKLAHFYSSSKKPPSPQGPSKKRGKVERKPLFPTIFAWAKRHFDDENGGFPIYLQHSGHSRTCVGYEQMGNGEQKLLLLDPSFKLETSVDLENARSYNGLMNQIRRRPANFEAFPTWYVLTVTGELLDDANMIARAKAGDMTDHYEFDADQ